MTEKEICRKSDLEVWEQDIHFDQATCDSTSILKPFVGVKEWDNLYENHLDTIPEVNLSSVIATELDVDMTSLDRPRKLSISDIIDVLNLQENKKRNARIIPNSESTEKQARIVEYNGIINQLNSEETSSEKEGHNFENLIQADVFDNFDCARNVPTKGGSVFEDECPVSFSQKCQSKYSSQSDGYSSCSSDSFITDSIGDTFPLDSSLLRLLGSPGDTIVLIRDYSNSTSCISTSKEKLRNSFVYRDEGVTNYENSHGENQESMGISCFLSNLRSACYGENATGQNLSLNFDAIGVGHKIIHKRGRKRIHQPDKPDDVRKDMRRERNNIASKIVRSKRKIRESMLFEKESALIKQNLTLKTQVKTLEKEIKSMREIFGMIRRV